MIETAQYIKMESTREREAHIDKWINVTQFKSNQMSAIVLSNSNRNSEIPKREMPIAHTHTQNKQTKLPMFFFLYYLLQILRLNVERISYRIERVTHEHHKYKMKQKWGNVNFNANFNKYVSRLVRIRQKQTLTNCQIYSSKCREREREKQKCIRHNLLYTQINS